MYEKVLKSPIIKPYIREEIQKEKCNKLLGKESLQLAPCLAEQGTQERKQPNSLTAYNILHINYQTFIDLFPY